MSWRRVIGRPYDTHSNDRGEPIVADKLDQLMDILQEVDPKLAAMNETLRAFMEEVRRELREQDHKEPGNDGTS